MGTSFLRNCCGCMESPGRCFSMATGQFPLLDGRERAPPGQPTLVLMWIIDRVLPNRNLVLLCCAVAAEQLPQFRTAAVLLGFGAYLTLLASQRTVISIQMEVLRRLVPLSAEYHENTPAGARLYTLREPIRGAYFGSDLAPAILRTALVSRIHSLRDADLEPAIDTAGFSRNTGVRSRSSPFSRPARRTIRQSARPGRN